jgi:4-amino-4-deoxy-L-arabinose transferase-like glycosyltransferase
MTTRISQRKYPIKIFSKSYEVSAQTVLFFLIVAAILLRLASSFIHGNSVQELPGIHDQISYDALARRLLDGHGFSFARDHWPLTRAGEPTAHWSYLYTWYLAGIYAMFGHQPLVARLLQAVAVGGLQTYVVYRIGEWTFSKSVGLIAAGITAFYIYFIYYSGALMTEPFYITAILCTLFVAMLLSENSSRHHDIRLGLLLGVAFSITILLRQVFLLFTPFLFLWMWFARFRRKISLPVIPTILSLVLVLLSILPLSLYNQSRFGRFVLLNTNSGYAFFWGNHPVYGTRFIPILPREMGSYQSLIPEDLRGLDEATMDQELLKRGLQFIIDDPKRYVLLSISRIPAYFMFWPSSDSSLISNVSRVASFGLTFPFMLYGLFLTTRKFLMEKGNFLASLLASPEGLLFLFGFIYTAIHLLTWALIRYRLPVDAVFMPFAAYALHHLLGTMQSTPRAASRTQPL